MGSNKTLAYLSLLILVIYVGLGIFLKSIGSSSVIIWNIFTVLYIILQLLGLAFLIMTTKIKDNHKRNLVRLGDLFVIVGAGIIIFKLPVILGYSLMAGGLMVILIDQLIRLKAIKNDLLIERLKIAWYIFFWTSVLFKGLHLQGARNLLFISIIVLWLAITRYIFTNGIPKYQ
ncbi:hypothetical protein [Labilibacter marinus]|uniref:hypothetical protein n=1 Tax=Labilibacter marinus TaxID=1477105 RepID=UPI00094FBE74|nr:hypothetical protein [Labilibacter marinus]